MAVKRFIGIDLGREAVKCAVLAVEKGAARVETFLCEPTNIATDADDDAWRSATGAILQGWREKKVFANASIAVTAPSAHALTRSLKLATATLDQQLPAEARQQLPFPLEELEWDYQTVGTEGDNSQISLAAVKSNIIDTILDLLGEAGIEPDAIDCGAMALGNLLLLSQGGSCKAPTAILSIGAAASNLVIIDGTRLWVRTIPVTGVSLISSLSKVLGKTEAETRALLFSSVNVAAGEAETDPAAKNVQVALGRIVMEITRSLTFYRSQFGGEKPERFHVTGAYSTVKGVTAYLAEKLKADVVPFAPSAAIPGADAKYDNVAGEAMGAAATLAGLTPYRFNLLPKDVQWQHSFDKKKPWLLAALYLLVATFAALAAFGFVRKGAVGSRALAATDALERAQGYHTQIAAVAKEIDSQLGEDENLRAILWERAIYSDAIENLASVLPTNSWLSGARIVPFREIYEQERTSAETAGDQSFAQITDENVLSRPVRIFVSGGTSGTWTEQQNALREAIGKLPNITGFKERALKPYKQYTLFDLDVDLDWDRNGVADIDDIRQTYMGSKRPGR